MGDILGGSLSVGDNGQTRLTGAGSDINFQKTVDKIIEARRAPAVRFENRIEDKQAQVDALETLKTRLSKLQSAADKLRGQPSFDDAGNVFEAKEGFLTASRDDAQTPSPANSIMTANVENSAEAASHDLEVLQTGQAHKAASDASLVAEAGTSLNDGANLGSTFDGGTFELGIDGNVKSVTIDGNDSLLDVRDKINAANGGDNPSGITASVVSISDNKNALQLSADKVGREMTLNDTSDTALQELGVLDGSGNIANELQRPQNAIFKADGLNDGSVQTTAKVDDPTANLTAAASVGSSDGDGTTATDVTLELVDSGGVTNTVNVDVDNTSLQDLANQIDATDAANARVVTQGGQSRLEINSESSKSLTINETTGTSFKSEAGIQVQDSISRQTNNVDDLFEGTTLNLIKAERGTDIQFDIETNQDAANEAIQNFVDAYNGVKRFINAQRQNVQLEDQSEDTVGALQGEPILSDAEERLSSILSRGADNVATDFTQLGQIGIDFVNNQNLDDKTKEDTLTIDQNKLNDALLNDFKDLRNLFRFDMNSTNSDFVFAGAKGQTAATDTNVEVTTSGGDVTDVKVGGSSVKFDASGKNFTIEEGSLDGLSMIFSGGDNETQTAGISTSRGVGHNGFFTAERLNNSQDGVLQSEVDRLTGRIDNYEEEVNEIDESLERERDRLMRQFINMEEALVELESAKQRLAGFTGSGGSSSGN